MTIEMIVTNARILTMDDAAPAASGLAIAGGRILAVGTDAQVMALVGPATRVIDGGGHSLLPGFVEAHTFAGRLAKLDRADRAALLFCGSTKSLATGLPMAGILFAGHEVALIILPLMLFHLLQLVVMAVLSRRASDG